MRKRPPGGVECPSSFTPDLRRRTLPPSSGSSHPRGILGTCLTYETPLSPACSISSPSPIRPSLGTLSYDRHS